MVKPEARRWVVAALMSERGISERRACGLVRLDRTSHRYVSKPRDEAPPRARLLELAAERPRFGYRRLTVILRRQGGLVNHKRVQRLYREEGLAIRRKQRRHVSQASTAPKPIPEGADERWSMDFMQDTMMDERCFRLLNAVDDFSREALAMDVAQSITGERLVRVLD
jgi:putative transposase